MPVTVVNMVPNSLSNETGRDSEPNVSATFLDPSRIAASVFTPDPLGSGNAPIYLSADGGHTWTLIVKLPGGNKTGDTTLRFVGGSNVLYAGILRSDTSDLNILRDANFTLPGLMTVLVDKTNDDQPYVEGGTVLAGPGTGSDRVYVGENDFAAPSGHTATVDFSLDAATVPPPPPANFVTADPIETRGTVGQDGPPTRPAVHLDGTVYALYLGWRTGTTTDVVVVRDDNWASGPAPFTALTDGGDGAAGMRVATGVPRTPLGNMLGTQRVGGQCAIAVDPRNSSIVYIAWADGTTGANQTIHVRRSVNRGVTWTGDLATTATATNPALAINRHGAVGFLYQQLHNPGSGDRWQTHFQFTTDGFGSVTDLILADLADNKGSYTGPNPIGDYAGLIAVGKNLYGVFCGFNTPDNANFPNGVIYQRNANFGTHVLTDLANNAVAASIDPFFFRFDTVALSDDFYVRDWTDNPAAGDNGAEPSIRPVFYATSDVWNRRGTLPGTFPNDQPDNEDAGNGAGNIGDNWAFARIRRNAAAAAGSQDVSAHFLVSKFGTGSNYVDGSSGDPDVTFSGSDPVVTFAAGDLGPLVTPPQAWHLAAIASTHLCLAVEITAPNDPFDPPSLVGNTPGWPTTDLRIINDNNKAQRNMGLSTTPARGVGMSDCYFAIAHNAAPFPRDMELRYEVAPEVLRRLHGASLGIVGHEEIQLAGQGALHLPAMQPGENRWLGLRFPAAAGDEGQQLTVNFFEVSGGVVVNGFAMGARLGTVDTVIAEKLRQVRSVFGRIGAVWQLGEAEEIATLAAGHVDARRHGEGEFLEYLRRILPAIDRILRQLVETHGRRDVFSVLPGVRNLEAALGSGNVGTVPVALSCLLNRIDSWVTMLQLQLGDVADILLNVRWQRVIYMNDVRIRKLGCARDVIERSEAFIVEYGKRRLTNHDYPGLLAELSDCFAETARLLPQLDLTMAHEAVRHPRRDLRRLQRAHAGFLGRLQHSHTGS